LLSSSFSSKNQRSPLTMQATHQEPVSISLLVPRVPRDLNTISLKCLEKDPAKRYQTAGDLAADLGRFLKNEPIHARPLSWAGHCLRWRRRHKGVAASLSGVVFLIALVIAGSFVATAHFRALEQEEKAPAEGKEIERGKAVIAEQDESKLRELAENDDRDLRKNSYFDQMNLAAQAANSPSGIGRVGDWLAPWALGKPDLRNWELFYLNGLCHRDLLTLFAHDHDVQDVAWSAEGERIASADSDGKIRLWGAYDGREIRCLASNQTDIRRIAWSPDGQRIASASWDGTINIWDPNLGRKIMTLPGNGTYLLSIAWSPDGKYLASAGQDQTVKIWDVASGAVQYILRGHTAEVRDIAWKQDGTQIASAGADHDIRIWNMTTGREIRNLQGHTNFVNRVAWSADGTRLASASNDNTAKIWDPVTTAATVTSYSPVIGDNGQFLSTMATIYNLFGANNTTVENGDIIFGDRNSQPNTVDFTTPTPVYLIGLAVYLDSDDGTLDGPRSVGTFTFTADGTEELDTAPVNESIAVNLGPNVFTFAEPVTASTFIATFSSNPDLDFTPDGNNDGVGPRVYELDGIVPEPASFGLLVTGFLSIVVARRRLA
jgi:WD40 repeat protein